MITVKPASKAITSNRTSGLALAGGGPLGAFYELGAICALEDCIAPLNLTDLDVYVGVSAGAFIAAGLANGIDTGEMVAVFALGRQNHTRFNPDNFLQPAYLDYLKNLIRTPELVTQAIWQVICNPLSTTMVDLLEISGKAIPTGIFNNNRLERFLREYYEHAGSSNDFRKLKKELHIIACELNTGKVASFNNRENADVPISKAIQASCALPGLYAPVEINDTLYVDGALRRTMNASAALKKNIHLLFAVNPIVPFERVKNPKKPRGLAAGGLPMVMSQTFRSIVQSRLKSGLEKYDSLFPHADIILIEPDYNDEVMFTTNLFSYSQRAKLSEYAFQQTRRHMQQKADSIDAVLKRHGLKLDRPCLEETTRGLNDFVQGGHSRSDSISSMHRSLDQLEALIHRLQSPAP